MLMDVNHLLTSFVQPHYQLFSAGESVHPCTNRLSDCPAMERGANLAVGCRRSIIQRTAPEKLDATIDFSCCPLAESMMILATDEPNHH